MNGSLPSPCYVYLVPVYQEERFLEAHVHRILEHFDDRPEAAVVALGVNGCTDRSADIARRLAEEHPGRVLAASTDAAGLGHGLALAFEAFLADHPQPRDDRFVVMTAADLPFGFSDLESFERRLAERPDLCCAVGSKAHPGSRVRTSPVRAAATLSYRFARRVLLGMHVGDSQGSIFLRDAWARRWVPFVQSRGFFFSTELLYHVEGAGCRVDELPVNLQASRRPSTVRPFAHGLPMLGELVRLRMRPRS